MSGYLDAAKADQLLDWCRSAIDWQQWEISLFGRQVKQPRLTCWYGDPDAHYRYSGLRLEPLPWPTRLRRLRLNLEQELGVGFNSVLANAYRTGRDSMGWHADDEKELGDQPVIASVSLGETRRFLVRQKDGSGRGSRGINLEHGSLLTMRNRFQQTYQHSVPKTAKPVGWRINLTFRQVISGRSAAL